MTNKTVSLIYVNYQSEDLLLKNIEFINSQTFLPVKITLVNNSTSEKSEKLSWLEGIDFIEKETNVGFALANNDAVTRSREKYVALLNPDAFPDARWLEQLVSAAEQYPEFAAFGSCQLQQAKQDVLDGVGDVYHLSGLAWREGYGRELTDTERSSRKIFSPCAGAALYRKEAFEAVGGFDEDFFCYMEDVDLGFRLQLAGYQSMYVPDAVVHHVGGASSGGARSDFALYYGHRNMVWVFVKNMPSVLFWVLLPLHIAMNIAAIIIFTFKGKGKIVLRAKWDAILGLPKMWAKRRVIQAGRKVSLAYIWKIMDKRLFR